MMSNNEDKNFVRVGSSSSKYLFYLQLGAPLFPAGVQEYFDCQSQCVGSLGNMHLRGEITKLFIIATDKTDTAKTYVHTHLQMGTISNSISDIQKNILASTIFITLDWCLRKGDTLELSSQSWDDGGKCH